MAYCYNGIPGSRTSEYSVIYAVILISLIMVVNISWTCARTQLAQLCLCGKAECLHSAGVKMQPAAIVSAHLSALTYTHTIAHPLRHGPAEKLCASAAPAALINTCHESGIG